MSVDLSTQYLGMTLVNPLVVSAGPLTEYPHELPVLEEAGASALVLPSLWEEQIEHYDAQTDQLQSFGAEAFPEALNYFPEIEDRRGKPDDYLDLIAQAKKNVSIPIIASLNGITTGGWIRYAKMIQQAGADALELNVYFLSTDVHRSGADVELQYVELVEAVRSEVSIPLTVKIGPYFSSLPHFARQLVEAGADGLTLFNRFLQPDIDLDTLAVVPHVVLSDSREVRLPLRWIAILRPQLTASLAATSGVHSPADVVKLVLAGADVVMLMSALLQRGVHHLRDVLRGLRIWLEQKEYASITQMKGSMSQANCPDPTGFERANYMKALLTYSRSIESSDQRQW